MSATIAPTARPLYAVVIWSDENAIYIELTSIHGPCVLRYPLSEGGLSKALHLMSDQHRQASSPVYNLPPIPSGYKPKGDFNDDQREKARAVLRRLRVI